VTRAKSSIVIFEMKALVISNCAARAYVQGMQILFPTWDIRGLRSKDAVQLVEEGNEEFLNFAEVADVYVGTPMPLLQKQFPTIKFLQVVKSNTVYVYIPNFVFRGLHPDIFYLRTDVRPILPPDTMYSRLVVVSYLLGFTVKEAMAAFSEPVYRRIGDFDAFDDETIKVCETFDEYGIDVREPLQGWISSGQFVYTLNHAKAFVYFDILLSALRDRLISAEQIQRKQPLRGKIRDYLAKAPFWPVYPELAVPRRIPGSLVWHTRKDANYEQLNHETFVSRSYENLARDKDLSPALVPGFDVAKDAILSCSDT